MLAIYTVDIASYLCSLLTLMLHIYIGRIYGESSENSFRFDESARATATVTTTTTTTTVTAAAAAATTTTTTTIW